MKKVIFIELDGTLLNNKRQVSDRNITAIRKAETLGYEIVVCTGRAVVDCKKYTEKLNSNYLIYSNGNIFDCKMQKTIFENTMPVWELQKIYKIVNQDNMLPVLFTSNSIRYSDKELSPDNVFYDQNIVIRESVNDWLEERGVVQMLVGGRDFETVKKIKELCLAEMSELKISAQSRDLTDVLCKQEDGITYFGITSKTASKGNGIKKFREIFNINKKDCFAIGDDFNDFSMFSECGYNVAVANALPELKDKANYVTDTNDNDGVASFLENINTLCKIK